MALSANVPSTLVDVKEWLGITASDKDTFLTKQMNRATGIIEGFTKRKLKSREYTDKSEEVNVDGAIGGLIYLWQYPVTAISQVLIDDVLIDAGSYDWDPAGWVRLSFNPTAKENSQWVGSRIIRVDFTAGFSEADHPEEFAVIDLACIEQTAHLYWRAPQGKEARAGLDSRSQGDVSESFSDDLMIPMSVQTLLAPLVRTTWVPHRVGA